VRGQAATLRYLATTHLSQGQPERALERITASLDRSQASGASPLTLIALAAIRMALGDAAAADEAYQRAIERARQIRAVDQEASALTLYGRFLAQQARLPEARDRLTQAVAVYESLRAGLADADQRMMYASRSASPYEPYVDVLMALARQDTQQAYAREAFRAAERARARGLIDLLAASDVDVRRGVDRELVDREQSLRRRLNAKAALRTTVLMESRDQRRVQRLDAEIAEISRDWRDALAAMRAESPAFASLTEPETLSVEEVQRSLASS